MPRAASILRSWSRQGVLLRAGLLALGLLAPGVAAAQPLYPTWVRQADTLPPPTGPHTRGWFQLTYDELNRKTVMIGGSGSTYYNDIWWYDSPTDTWQQIEPFVNCDGIDDFVPPTKRDELVAAYDPENHLYWIFGGSGFGCGGSTGTTQAGTTSTQVVDTTLPETGVDHYKGWTVQALYTVNSGGLSAYVTAFDPASKTLTLNTPLGGLGPGMPYKLYPQRGGGTWYYSPVTHSWASLTGPHWGYTGPSPVSRLSPAFAYSPLHRAILMFGGVGGGGPRTDTWVLDVVDRAWVQMLPADAPGSPPRLTQLENSMVYDSRHDVFVLFGGLLLGSETSDTWVYRLSTNTWTKMNPPTSPPPRQQQQMSFDARSGVTVLFGGRRGSVGYSDLWVYDYGANSWTQLFPSNSPSTTNLGSMVYDPHRQASVLYRGGQIWTLELGSSPIVQPDLVVSSVAAPATAGAGSTIGVTETTRNQHATNGAGASTTAFFLSTNTSLSATDIPLGSRNVPPLGPGAVNSATTQLTIPAELAKGTYYIIARADAGSAITETDENNNKRATLAISIGADLTVSSLSIPATAGVGGSITITDVTSNAVGASPAGASVTRFHLSSNSTFEATDTPLGERTVPGLGPGTASPGSTPVTIPGGTAPGTYFIIARADANGAVGERTESNNTRTVSIKIGPDLIVSAITGPGAAAPGAVVSVSNTIKNQGGGSAGPFKVRFHLSTNTSVDAADTPVGSRDVSSLGAGASTAVSTPVTIPADTAPGSYFIVAFADADAQVAETSETNNTRASAAVKVGPDMIVSSLSGPGSIAQGGQGTFTDTTRNQGGALAAATTTRFYLSPDPVFGAGDVPVGSRPVPALPAGTSNAAPTTISIPPGTAPGSYYLIGVSDADGGVVEASESNNTLARAVSVF